MSNAFAHRLPSTRERGPGLARTNATDLDGVREGNAPVDRPRALEWLTYADAARYCGWSVAYLRNLVSAGQVPVYGRRRMRRFRRDMLDFFLTNPEAAMRRFRSERNRHVG